MEKIFDYVNKYGNYDFDEKALGELDMLIFSHLSYLDLSNFKDGLIYDIGLSLKNYDAFNLGDSVKTAYKLLSLMYDKKRYKNITMFNYKYILTDDVQVGVLSLKLLNNDVVISFEGTDNTFIGWKEDFALSYEYPTKSHLIASKYVSDTLNKNNCNIYLCGHSKGGNLALVSALRLLPSKKGKIKKIYSFDGPGIPGDIFKSMDYDMIKDRLINIIPNYSIVGVLLYQENLNVIKSDAIGIMQHEISSWIVEDDHLLRCEESSLSKDLAISIKTWLKKTAKEERRQIINDIFNIFIKSGIKTTDDIKENKIKSASVLLKNLTYFSKETKILINNYFKLLIGEFGNNIINDKKLVIKEKLKEIKDIDINNFK